VPVSFNFPSSWTDNNTDQVTVHTSSATAYLADE